MKKKKKVAKKSTKKTTRVTKVKKVAKKKATYVAKKKVTKKAKTKRAVRVPKVVEPVVVPVTEVLPVEVPVVPVTVVETPKKTKLTTPRRPTSTKTTGHYIDKAELLQDVLDSKKIGKMNNRLATKLQLLCKKVATHPWYARYTYIEDMQAYAMMQFVHTWSQFNPARTTNAFAYYTQCVKNSFQQFKLKERHQRKVKDKMLVAQGLVPSYDYQSEYDTELRHQLQEEHENQQRYRRVTQEGSDDFSDNE